MLRFVTEGRFRWTLSTVFYWLRALVSVVAISEECRYSSTFVIIVFAVDLSHQFAESLGFGRGGHEKSNGRVPGPGTGRHRRIHVLGRRGPRNGANRPRKIP